MDYIHTHGVVLQALGRVGNTLVRECPQQWPKKLVALEGIDWRRTNSAQWEGRALSGGRISKAGQSVLLTANVIKTRLRFPLTPEEQSVEEALNRGTYGE